MIRYFKISDALCLLLVLASVPSMAVEAELGAANNLAFEQTLGAIDDAHVSGDNPENVYSSTVADKPEKWSSRAREVLVNALSLTGIKYTYGGNTPEAGFDCSGFVRYVFKQATSLTLPHSALAISQLGRAVRKNELQPGDLVFFNTVKNVISHVGIYMGNNRFIHSPSTGGQVRIESMTDGYWAKRFSGAQRIDDKKNTAKEYAVKEELE